MTNDYRFHQRFVAEYHCIRCHENVIYSYPEARKKKRDESKFREICNECLNHHELPELIRILAL